MGIEFDCSAKENWICFVGKFLISLVSAGNLLATCTLGVNSFYLQQLQEKNPSQIGLFRLKTKKTRQFAHRLIFYSIPTLLFGIIIF